LKKASFFVEKTKGNYHSIYNEANFLNTEIITDMPNLFSSFFIDLRDIKTETKIRMDKSGLISLFENSLNGNSDAIKELNQFVQRTTNMQYKKGV